MDKTTGWTDWFPIVSDGGETVPAECCGLKRFPAQALRGEKRSVDELCASVKRALRPFALKIVRAK